MMGTYEKYLKSTDVHAIEERGNFPSYIERLKAVHDRVAKLRDQLEFTNGANLSSVYKALNDTSYQANKAIAGFIRIETRIDPSIEQDCPSTSWKNALLSDNQGPRETLRVTFNEDGESVHYTVTHLVGNKITLTHPYDSMPYSSLSKAEADVEQGKPMVRLYANQSPGYGFHYTESGKKEDGQESIWITFTSMSAAQQAVEYFNWKIREYRLGQYRAHGRNAEKFKLSPNDIKVFRE